MTAPDIRSPRYVCMARQRIIHQHPTRDVWVKDIWGGARRRAVEPGERVLVIFSPGDPKFPPQVRLYPLTPERAQAEHKADPILEAGYDLPERSHLIQSGHGVHVYIGLASRRRRVEMQLRRAESGNWGDIIEALVDLDHLIFHRAMCGELGVTAERENQYGKIQKLKALALSTQWPAERDNALRQALRIAARLARE